MSATEPFNEEQTITFRPPAGWNGKPASNDPVHVLLLLDENAAPKRIPIAALPAVIGRAPPADVILEGGTVSRRHCRLEQSGDQALLSDLGSTNGTFVNGEQISAPIALRDGAIIGIGAYRLRYHRRTVDEAAEVDALEREWNEAVDYVASILPPPLTEGPVLAEWFYLPCARVGGDAFGYQMIDSRNFAVFVLDVAGHGTGAALHAVSVVNVLRQRLLPDVDFHDPAAVIRGLNRMFPMDQYNALFFTIWYGVYHIEQRVLTFATGGHHPAWLLPPAPLQPVALSTRNPSIGIAPDRDTVAARVGIPPGSVLHLFSDGVFEIVDRHEQQWGMEQVLRLLPDASGAGGPRLLYERVRAAARPGLLEDDFSALLLRFP
ncbi:MAG TPA: SpoIIE family protein phosphatase [Acetobacteraceae bacterium]|nr:SpoIIE family protein phosphatase [Acetobacteraceae bacterium]